MEKKYGRTALARTRAQLNYRARKRREDKRTTALLPKLLEARIQQRMSSIQGIIRHRIKNGREKAVLLGGRDLFYRELSGEWDEPVLTIGKRAPAKEGQLTRIRINLHRDVKTGRFIKKASARAKLERFQYMRTAQGKFCYGARALDRPSKRDRDYKRQLKLWHQLRFGQQEKELHVSWDEPNL